jgi:nicotinate-nucleotide adenylyltransferase
MTRAKRIGIFGGTFNPIHHGHLRAAEEVREALDLERLVFVPSAQPPHKNDHADDPMAPAAERLRWTRAAVAGNGAFDVDALEVDRGGPSYSIDTVRALGATTAPELPVFVIGCDAFALLGTWLEPEALFELAHFAVMTRPPVTSGSLADWLPGCVADDVELAEDGLSGRHRRTTAWIRLVPISALDISSSDIRARIRNGRSIRYLVPEPVREAVLESGVYGGGDPGA